RLGPRGISAGLQVSLIATPHVLARGLWRWYMIKHGAVAVAIGVAGLLIAGCGSDSNKKTSSSTTTRSDTPARQPATGTKTSTGTTSMNVAPETRILSILHNKNLEEIQMGRLAQERGASQEVKEFGKTLVRDHTDADSKVVTTSREVGVTLMSSDRVKQ